MVLSPHYDDAAFSLCLSISTWASSSLRVRVLNFFTESAYAPRATVPERSIPALREREDRHALFAIDRSIAAKSCGLLDAPLRLGIPPQAVFSRSPDENTCRLLATAIAGCTRNSLVLCPLGLGNHVDHLAVRSAATLACRAVKLGFYEDLPYAIWTSEDELRERVKEAEKQTGVSLRPVVIRRKRPVWNKRRIISRYASQITPEEADRMARFGSRYGGGERIWIPQYGRGLTVYSTRHSASAKGHS